MAFSISVRADQMPTDPQMSGLVSLRQHSLSIKLPANVVSTACLGPIHYLNAYLMLRPLYILCMLSLVVISVSICLMFHTFII